MGSIQSSTGQYQPKSDLYQIVDSPAKPLVPTIPHMSPFRADSFRINTSSLGVASQYTSNFGTTNTAGGKRLSPVLPTNSFQTSFVVPPSSFAYAPANPITTYPYSQLTSRFSNDYNPNINVIPPIGSTYESPAGKEPPSIYSYSPPKYNQVPGQSYNNSNGSPAFAGAANIYTSSPSTVERMDYKADNMTFSKNQIDNFNGSASRQQEPRISEGQPSNQQSGVRQ